MCFGGNPRFESSRSDVGGTFGVALQHGGIMFGAVAGRWRQEVEWFESTMSMTSGLSDVVHRGLGDRRVMMDSRRAGAPFDAVAALMADLVRGFILVW
jgi:hypothetical protein